MNYIDLFAGAGGLSEGFIRAGFSPVAHIEMDKEAVNTLKTRMAYHYLFKRKKSTYIMTTLKVLFLEISYMNKFLKVY